MTFLSVMPVAAIPLIRERRLSGARKPAPRGARVAYWIILGISILNLLVLVAPAWGAMGGISNELFDLPSIMKMLLGLGVLSVALTVGALVYGVLAWKDRCWGVAFRVYYTLVTVAAVASVWFLNYWNLLGWRFWQSVGEQDDSREKHVATPDTVDDDRLAEAFEPILHIVLFDENDGQPIAMKAGRTT